MLVEQLKENYFFAVIRGKDKEDAKNNKPTPFAR